MPVSKLEPGMGVLYRTWSYPARVIRGVVVEHQQGISSGVTVDWEEPFDRWTPFRRVFLITGGEHSFDPDPAGPWAPFRVFRCSNRGCYFHSPYAYRPARTSLPSCPNCGQEITHPEEVAK